MHVISCSYQAQMELFQRVVRSVEGIVFCCRAQMQRQTSSGPILSCHTVFTLGWAQASVWSWQAGFRGGKQENGSLALCVSSLTPTLCLNVLWKAAVLFAFDKSLTFTGCVEFALAGPLFKYPLPAKIQSAHLWVWKGVRDVRLIFFYDKPPKYFSCWKMDLIPCVCVAVTLEYSLV